MALPVLLGVGGAIAGGIIGWLLADSDNKAQLEKEKKKYKEEVEKEHKKNERMKSELSKLQEMQQMQSRLQEMEHEMKQKQSQLPLLEGDIHAIHALKDAFECSSDILAFSNALTQYEEIISKYNLKKFFEAYDDFLFMRHGKSKITCLGLSGGGKTTLLNALTGLDDSCLTESVPYGTQTIQKYDSEKFCYVDIPGLDTNDGISDETISLIMDLSALNLFVHDLAMGELTPMEISYLSSFYEIWGEKRSSFLLRSTIFVLNCQDKISEAEVLQVKDRIFTQIRDIFCTKDFISLIAVSAKRYNIAKVKNEEGLIQSSNIPLLQNLILDKYNLVQSIQERQPNQRSHVLTTKLMDLFRKLEQERTGLLHDMDRLKSSIVMLKRDIIDFSKEF